ncbi:hypothetical protein GCM10020295_44930 [Streptomyces cinereospinus]
MANARDRVSADEQSTIIVASAGCNTACPAPSAAADASTAVALPVSPRLSAPAAAVTRAASSTGSEPRRTRARPANGSTISAATAKTARTSPAVTAPSPPHLRHIDVQVGDGEAEPEGAECVTHVDPVHRCAHRPGHVHLFQDRAAPVVRREDFEAKFQY